LTKRFLAIPQAYLGIAFGFGIPMGYAAVLDDLPPECGGCCSRTSSGPSLTIPSTRWSIAEDDVRIGI